MARSRRPKPTFRSGFAVRSRMPSDSSDAEASTLAPDEAFGVLGNDTRMGILRALAEAEAKLSFSELRDRVGMRDSGQFSYHLGRLEGHFLRKGQEGYELRQAGTRVIEAVLSGAVTEAPVVERTAVDVPCFRCGAPIEVSFREERVESYCTACTGIYGEGFGGAPAGSSDGESAHGPEYGYLGGLDLPSAGIRGRTPTEVFEAAFTWTKTESLAAACGICPRCAAPIEESVDVCETHDTADGPCEECGSRYAVLREWTCTNCNRWSGGPLYFKCWADTEVLAFLTARGVNPFTDVRADGVEVAYEEELRSVEPFEAAYTITADGDSLVVTFGGDLSVERVTADPPSGAD